MKKLAFALLALALCSCEWDSSYYKAEYEKRCPEAQAVPFEKLSGAALCGGQPIIFAILQLDQWRLNEDGGHLVEYLARQGQLNANIVEPGTGRNPLMVAIDAGQKSVASALVSYTNLKYLDSLKRSYLHHIALTNWSDQDDLRQVLYYMPKELVDSRDANGQTPLELAYANGNFTFSWFMIEKGANSNFIKKNPAAVKPNFLFHPKVNDNVLFLDDLGPLIRAKFSVDFKETRDLVGYDRYSEKLISARDYQLIHFASAYGLRNLFDYLIKRDVSVNESSSEGSPLQLAIANKRPSIVETLMSRPDALSSARVINSAMRSGDDALVKRLVGANVPILDYSNLMFSACDQNLCANITNPNIPWYARHYDERDPSGNSLLMQGLFARAYCGSDGSCLDDIAARVRARLDGQNEADFAPNKVGQNFAHFFMALVTPDDEDMYSGFLPGIMSTGSFTKIMKAAAPSGLLDQLDVLRMTPLHYWLANPARRRPLSSFMARSGERSRLNALLSATKKLSTVNINGDSIVSLAVMTGNPELVQEILNYDSSLRDLILVPNRQGKTPLQLAKDRKMEKTYALLQSMAPKKP